MISFNEGTFLGTEFDYIKDAIDRKHISGDGYYTQKCNEILENARNCRKGTVTRLFQKRGKGV